MAGRERIVTGHTRGEDWHVTEHTNGQERPLLCWHDLNDAEKKEVDYLKGSEWDEYRLFRYLGSVYDYHEFDVASVQVKSLGWDAIQTDSYFSAVVVRYFDEDGHELEGIIVGRIHW